jgi:hypothetical protein
MALRVLRRARAALMAAVSPEPLSAALSNLVQAGLIEGFEERPREVLIWGDLAAIESRLGVSSETTTELAAPVDRRGEYYRRCRQYLHTRSFRQLPSANRAIFRLHANGVSHSAIALKLGVSLMKVRGAVRGARLAADLPATASSMPRGGGPGRPPTPESERVRCGTEGCGKPAESRGLCNLHYQRERRRRNLT